MAINPYVAESLTILIAGWRRVRGRAFGGRIRKDQKKTDFFLQSLKLIFVIAIFNPIPRLK
jgi:hypothetical protein